MMTLAVEKTMAMAISPERKGHDVHDETATKNRSLSCLGDHDSLQSTQTRSLYVDSLETMTIAVAFAAGRWLSLDMTE
jgi:hypothetical protein